MNKKLKPRSGLSFGHKRKGEHSNIKREYLQNSDIWTHRYLFLIKNLDNILHLFYCTTNIEPRSCNHCCSGQAIGITYSECVFVALGIQHAMRMPKIVIRGLLGSTVFFYIIS